MTSRIRRTVVLPLLLAISGLLVAAWRQDLGFRHFRRYQELRSEATNIQSGFENLEEELRRSIRFYGNPLFFRELGRLYLDRAQAEDRFGDPARRDAFLDEAATAEAESARRNPSDGWTYFDLAKIWLLYNSPLLTYAEKGRIYLRTALELYPGGDFINLNAIYLFLIQWDSLTIGEKSFVLRRIEHKYGEKHAFISFLHNKWISGGGDPAVLKSILMTDARLWARVASEFE